MYRQDAAGTHKLEVGAELVEEMVDDVCSEDADARAVGLLLGFPGDWNIKGQDDRKLLAAFLQHGASTHDVTLVDWSNVDARDRDLDCVTSEELQEGFQGSQGGCLDAHALAYTTSQSQSQPWTLTLDQECQYYQSICNNWSLQSIRRLASAFSLASQT